MSQFAAVVVILLWGLLRPGVAAEVMPALTLKQAEEHALIHHPRIREAELQARADDQQIRSARAALFPQLGAVAEVVEAGDSTHIAASGGLNNPTVFRRESNGLLATQLLTDFGRTSKLTASARYRAEAAGHTAEAIRARVLLEVDRAYFETLRAGALLRVADQTVDARTLIADRVSALAKAQLKSGLDVSFAEVSLREAALLKLRSQDRLETAYAALAAALGDRQGGHVELQEEPLPPVPPDDVGELIRAALVGLPELEAIRSDRQAAAKAAEATRADEYPVVSAIGAVGLSPWRDDRLDRSYASGAVAVSIPLFTGGRLQARASEAALRVRAADSVLAEEENEIERDVRIAWLEARTAFKAIEVTDSLVASASQAYELAESRYNLGVSSIVELSQAALQKTEAEIASTTARYDCQVKSAELDFRVGRKR
jgi:outer membrane protein